MKRRNSTTMRKKHKKVWKKAFIYSDGRHEIKIEMNIKNQKVVVAIATLFDQLKELYKITKIDRLVTARYYYSGIVAGLVAMEGIDKLQACELMELIGKAVSQQIECINSNRTKESEVEQ